MHCASTRPARSWRATKTLLAGGAIGQETYDKSQLAFSVASSEHAQARANVQAIEAVLANMSHPRQLRRGGHRAPPRAGRDRDRRCAGADRDEPGRPLGAHLYPGEPHRRGALGGYKATIITDTWPDKHYGGEVMYIAVAGRVHAEERADDRGAREAGVCRQGAHRRDDPHFELKPGMPADVRLERLAP